MAATGVLLAAACGGDDPPGEAVTPRAPASSESSAAATETGQPQVDGVVAEGLTSPWGLAFLPDGSALVSERDTALIKRIGADRTVTEVGEVADVEPQGEGGLLGIAFRDDWLYAYFTSGEDNRIVRLPYTDGGLGDAEVLLDEFPRRASTTVAGSFSDPTTCSTPEPATRASGRTRRTRSRSAARSCG